jgi:hypothetical protein
VIFTLAYSRPLLGLEPVSDYFPSACFVVPWFMAKTGVARKKKRGPAPTGKGTQIQVRLQPDQLAGLDAWIEKQEIKPTRPEAIRSMIDATLHVVVKDPGEKPATRRK